MRFKKLSIVDRLFLIYLASYFLVFLPTFWLTSPTADEGTHLLLAQFYRDLIKNIFSTKNFSFQHAYNFGINYLVHYPKLQIAYPPFFHLIVGLGPFSLFGASLFAGRFIGLLFAVLTYSMLYVLIKKFFNQKIAFIAVLLFSLNPHSLLFSKRAMMDFVAYFFMLFSIFLYQHFLKTKKTKYLFSTGIIASLAALSKQFAGIIFIFIFFHLLLKKYYKKLLIFSLSFLILLIPYLLILSKAGGFYISYLVGYKYALWTGEPTSPLNPAFWTFYLTESTKRFYLLPLVLVFFIFYLYKKEKYWKEMLLYFLMFYFLISAVPNKELRFSQYFLLPTYLATAFYFSKFDSKILFIFFIGYTLLSLYPIRTTFVYYPTQEISQFVYENLPQGANVAISSEKAYTFSSAYMFYLSVLDKNRSISVYRSCAFDNKTSEEILTILKENNIYFILEDPKINDTFVRFIRDEIQEVQVDDIKSIKLYFVKNFTYTEPTEKCNFICLTQEKICIKEVV